MSNELYKGEGNKNQCSNHRGISLLNILGTAYGKVVLVRVLVCKEHLIGEGQCSSRRGRTCIDQVFILKILRNTWRVNCLIASIYL